MKRKPYVLCIAAWVAGGKTTVVNELLNRLPNTKALYFDSYRVNFLRQDYYQWSINGNDYNDWRLEPIAHDIEKLLKEELDYIFLEIPMGNTHDVIAKYIDYTVFLDVPADVLLARSIMRDYCKRPSHKKKLDDPLASLSEWLTDYISRLRVTVFNYINVVKPRADLVIDGYRPVETIVDEIIQAIKETCQ